MCLFPMEMEDHIASRMLRHTTYYFVRSGNLEVDNLDSHTWNATKMIGF